MKFNYTVDYPNKRIFVTGKSFFGVQYHSQATCAPYDAFSVQKGKEVGRLKVAKKQSIYIEKILNQQIKEQIKIIDTAYDRLNHLNTRKRKLLEKREKIENRLKEM